jgi:site-specific recombinase XerD
MKHSLSILFWLLSNRVSKKTGETPIMARITIDGKRAEISTSKKIHPEKWNVNSGRMRGNSEEARTFNRALNKMQYDLERIFERLQEDDQFISAQAIKNIYQGKNVRQHLLLELFRYHNGQVKAEIGKGYSKGTHLRFETVLTHTGSFIKDHYGKEDMNFNELKYDFITEFEHYLKSQKEISHNTVIRYLKIFKKIVLIALKNEWIPRDPFSRYTMTMKEVKKGYLTKEELQALYSKEFGIERLEHVRDIFLFCCYTGLSYADVQKLTPDNISKGLDGEFWIFVERTKTGASSNVPLLPIALEMIQKYEKHPMVLNTELLLPVISNQKMNAYLKEIATLCEIKKNITFHMARHTFATTITLSNGVSIETVSSMLGHKNLKTTQIYAKVVQEKVSQDMKKLKEVLGGSDLTKAVNQ